MNIEELCVGNWLWNKINRKPEKIQRVLGDVNSVMLDYNDVYFLDPSSNEDIEPLEITEPRLQECGFSRTLDLQIVPMYEYRNDLWVVYLVMKLGVWFFGYERKGSEEEWMKNVVCDIPILYFHQLQNLMMVFGIDIKINFKQYGV